MKIYKRVKNRQNVCLLKAPTRQKKIHHIIHIHDDTLHMLHLITHVTNCVTHVMCRHECVKCGTCNMGSKLRAACNIAYYVTHYNFWNMCNVSLVI